MLATQWRNVPALFKDRDSYQGSQRQWLEQAKLEYGIPDGARCLLYGPQIVDDAGYHFYMGRYVLWTQALTTCVPGDIMTYGGLTGGYQYIIVMEHDESIDALLTQSGLPVDQKVYQMY